VATLELNTADEISFRNVIMDAKVVDYPALSAQLGIWELGQQTETGIVIDAINGPVLSPNNARKLAKWLTDAADQLDGSSTSKKNKRRQHWEDDDEQADETGTYKF